MKLYDEQLQQLQEQIAKLKRLNEKAAELRRQRGELETRVRELEKIKLDEQADVARLEGRSLASFFYNVIGRKDELLNKEREEAYAARVKYDVAVRELAEVKEEWLRYEQECEKLRGCEQSYEKVLKEKAAAVKAVGGEIAEKIFGLEERFASLEGRKKELREAISAGNSALSTANYILSSLNSARKLGTWDLVLDGGLIADMAKYRHLDEAQDSIERLQSQLRRFKTELTDVTIRADMQINVDGFLRFADYFFDGLFADWAVINKIDSAKNEVQGTASRIRRALDQLNEIQKRTEQEQKRIKDEVDTLVKNA